MNSFESILSHFRASGQPYHHVGDELKCVVLNTDNEMQLVDCLGEYISICKRPTEITSIPPDSYGCSEGQYEYQVTKIKLLILSLEFDNAYH